MIIIHDGYFISWPGIIWSQLECFVESLMLGQHRAAPAHPYWPLLWSNEWGGGKIWTFWKMDDSAMFSKDLSAHHLCRFGLVYLGWTCSESWRCRKTKVGVGWKRDSGHMWRFVLLSIFSCPSSSIPTLVTESLSDCSDLKAITP